MRISVDPARCQGHALCLAAAPELFDSDDDSGHAFVPEPEVPPGLTLEAQRAANGCPEHAIGITD